MGLFVGSKTEIASFKASGTKLAKGIVQKGASVGGIIGKTSAILSPVAKASTAVTVASTVGKDSGIKKLAKTVTEAIPDLPGTWDDKAKKWIVDNPVASTVIATVGVGALGATAYALTKKKSTKKKTTKKKKSSKKKSTSKRRSKKRRYGTEAQYKRKGGLDVKYTKNGQPYVIQRNGRARFIKRSRR